MKFDAAVWNQFAAKVVCIDIDYTVQGDSEGYRKCAGSPVYTSIFAQNAELTFSMFHSWCMGTKNSYTLSFSPEGIYTLKIFNDKSESLTAGCGKTALQALYKCLIHIVHAVPKPDKTFRLEGTHIHKVK